MRHLPAFRNVAAALAFAFASSVTAQEPLSIQLGEPVARVTADTLGGYNFGLSMAVALNLDEWAALNIGMLRWPPGNDADNYTITRDMVEALRTPWQVLGRPEFLVVTNFFEGVPHALRTMELFERAELPIRMWAIGNEPDLYPQNRMDPTWTVEVYCERFRDVADALRAADPDAVITGPAVSGSRPLGVDFLREFLERCGDVIDVLTWHVYPTDGTAPDEVALATSDQVDEEIRLFRSWLRDPERNPLGYERDIDLAITEFGLSWRTNNFRHLEDIFAAVWLADALGRMSREGLDHSHYFALQAMGGHGLIDRTGWVRPTYHVYAMLADFRGEALAVEGADRGVTAYAVRNERGTQLLLVNRSLERATVTPPLEGATLHVTLLDEPTYDETLEPLRFELEPGASLELPARSVVHVRSAP